MTKDKTYVEKRLMDLHTSKEVYKLQSRACGWKRKANMQEVTEPDSNDFRTQASVITKMQKDAELMSAIPEFLFKPLDKKGRINRKIMKYVFDYHWLISGTDKTVSEVVQSSTTFGTGIAYEGIKHVFKNVKIPSIDSEGKIEFKDEEKLQYSGIDSRKVPFENFFINGNSIEESTEACVITYYDKDQYCMEKDLDPNYTSISTVKETALLTPSVTGTVGNNFSDIDLDNTVMQIEYYNIARDEYIVIANGIEVRNTPNPYPHKELPFALYIGDKAEDRIWGIGIFELLEQDERYKNELRTLFIRGVKFSIGFFLKNRSADIEEDELISGLGETYETDDMEGLKQLSFTVPIRDINEAEGKVDNDMIAKSGIDHRSLYLSPNETAEMTRNKGKSVKKRINKNIKDNAYSFFNRLAYLRIANIQFLHQIKEEEIPIEGGSINSKGIFEKDEQGGTGSAVITKDLVAGKFMLIPLVETMIGDSKDRRREDAKEFGAIVSPLVNEDGSKVFPGGPLGKLLSEEWNYDFEELTQSTNVTSSPEKTLEKFKLKNRGTTGSEEDPNFVGLNQRGGNTNVPTLSGRANQPE